LLIPTVLLLAGKGLAQDAAVNWIDFEQLEDSLTLNPKKVFIDFYADWCAYCKKMDQAAFRDPEIISVLHREYYAVRMNAESTDTIVFGGEPYINREVGKKRKPNHEIPLMLASRQNYPFTLPAIVLLNEKFEITARYFEYMSPEKLLEALTE
jgi:thioredoxin-related protein